MTTSSRQELIPGWDQERLRRARIAIIGKTSLASQITWAARSLGIGTVVRLGSLGPGYTKMDRWLSDLRMPDSRVYEFGTLIEYLSMLEWALEGPLAIVVIATEDRREMELSQQYAAKRRTSWIAATACEGGFISGRELPQASIGPESVVIAQAVGALVIDNVRRVLCPLTGEGALFEGALGWSVPAVMGRRFIWQAGVGGIGVYSAYSAAGLGFRQHLIDFDYVEPSNLNRQGLFSVDDAEHQSSKAEAACRSLSLLFPHISTTAEVGRVSEDYLNRLEKFEPRPDVLVSALDNAVSRLAVADLGRILGIPVVQGGTATFAADCVTQLPGGLSLDEQLKGTMTAAIERERERARGRRCTADASYIVPSMVCGALVALRVLQVLEGCRILPPIRWRSGTLPIEDRSQDHADYFTSIIV